MRYFAKLVRLSTLRGVSFIAFVSVDAIQSRVVLTRLRRGLGKLAGANAIALDPRQHLFDFGLSFKQTLRRA